MEHYTLEELEEMYGHSLASPMTTCIFRARTPMPGSVFLRDFTTSFLNGLLADSQTAFPGLSMEVRLDVDPVGHARTEVAGGIHAFHPPFPSGNAAYTSAMYSVPMGLPE
ncbi:MAG: hypothetical protein ACLTW9_25125 [Enterocloster sp.]